MMKNGFGMVEVVVATAIVAGFILILATINTTYLKISFKESSIIQASFLSEEGIEAMRFARDSSWSSNLAPLTPGVEYFLKFSGTSWQATTTPVYIGIFDRRVKVEQVNRDANDNIVTSGGTLDPNTLLITSTVSWMEHGATTTKITSDYLTNLFAN